MLYWPIHFYDSTLLVDPTIAPQLPFFTDLEFHFFPAVLMLIDTLFFSPPWETSALLPLLSFSLLAGGYWMWVEHCFLRNNFYPYPLLGILTHEQRIVLFALATLLCWMTFLIVRGLYRLFNGHIDAKIAQAKKQL